MRLALAGRGPDGSAADIWGENVPPELCPQTLFRNTDLRGWAGMRPGQCRGSVAFLLRWARRKTQVKAPPPPKDLFPKAPRKDDRQHSTTSTPQRRMTGPRPSAYNGHPRIPAAFPQPLLLLPSPLPVKVWALSSLPARFQNFFPLTPPYNNHMGLLFGHSVKIQGLLLGGGDGQVNFPLTARLGAFFLVMFVPKIKLSPDTCRCVEV